MKHAKNIIKINCEVISKQIKRSFQYFYSTLTFKIRHELWSLGFKVAHVLVKFRFRMENFTRLNLCENFSAKNTSCWGVNKNVLSTPFLFLIQRSFIFWGSFTSDIFIIRKHKKLAGLRCMCVHKRMYVWFVCLIFQKEEKTFQI